MALIKAPSKQRMAMRDSKEAALVDELREIATRQEAAILRQTRKIIKASEAGDINEAYRLLDKFDVPLTSQESEALSGAMIAVWHGSNDITKDNLRKAHRKYDSDKGKKALINELTAAEKEDPSVWFANQYRDWANEVTGIKYADTLTASKDVIRNGIAGGWGLKPFHEYRKALPDGTYTVVPASRKSESNVSRVQTTPGVINELSKSLAGKKTYQLEAIARTEMTRAQNDGMKAASKDDPFVKGFEFFGVQDSRQSEICAALSGVIWDKNDPRVDFFTPPLHKNCRSELVEVFVTDDLIADFDKKTWDVDGETFKVSDLKTGFNKAGLGAKAFDPPLAKKQRQAEGIPEAGFPVRTPLESKEAFVKGEDTFDWRAELPPVAPPPSNPKNNAEEIEKLQSDLEKAAERTAKSESDAQLERERIASLRATENKIKADIAAAKKKSKPVGQGRQQAQTVNVDTEVSNLRGEIRSLKYESFGAYDKNGKLLVRRSGTSDEITLSSSDVKKMIGSVDTEIHNHPSSSSFSLADIQASLGAGSRVTIVTSPRYDYLMDGMRQFVNKKGGRDKAIRSIRRLHKFAEKRQLDEAISKIKKGELSVEDANLMHNHNVWSDVARQAGMIYSRTER